MSPLISESKENFPMLVVDRIGTLGKSLVKKISQDSTVVYVSQVEPLTSENIIHIPFERKIPKIPANIYSHIFLIDDGDNLTMDSLYSFLDKAKEDKAVFVFCTSLRNQEKISSDIFDYKKSRVIFLGDIFPAGDLFSRSYINRFINSSKNKGKIDIPKDGMSISYPVFFEDAILGILEASFGTSAEKTYFLFPKHGITLLSLAHLIQKIDPNIKIDFSNEEPIETSVSKEGKYILTDKYPLEERLNRLKIKAGSFEKKSEDEFKGIENEAKSSSSMDLRVVFFAIVFFLFLPLFTTLLFSFLAFLSLDIAKNQSGNTKYLLSFSDNSFKLANIFSKTLIYESGFLNINALDKLTQSIEKGRSNVESMFDYYNALDSFSNGQTIDGILSLKNFLVFAQTAKDFKVLKPPLFNFISQTINVWPQIFGVDSKKTYLVLLQNNFIPRPTGGVIQAFGFLTFEGGKFLDFKVYNAYDSDKKLKGHVEPPFPLRRYLKSTHWFLKDSNFNPDFSETAASSSFFSNLEENKKVDGVIAMDMYFLQKLKESTSDKDSDKFLETASSRMGDQNFASTILKETFDNLNKKDSSKIFLSNMFVDLIEKKHAIFEFNDQSIENVFSTNGFSSNLSDNRDNAPKKINDFLSISEADLGEPIQNVKRKLSMNAVIAKGGEVSSDVSLEYTNAGNTDFKNYLRFITPAGSSISKIKIDGNDTDFVDAVTDPSVYESKDFTAPQKLEVEKYTQNGKNFFGVFIIIPKGNIKTIEIVYKLEEIPSLSTLSDFSYNLKFFKQPGIEPYPFKLLISYPDSFKTSQNPSFSTMVEKDFDLNFNFSQK